MWIKFYAVIIILQCVLYNVSGSNSNVSVMSSSWCFFLLPQQKIFTWQKKSGFWESLLISFILPKVRRWYVYFCFFFYWLLTVLSVCLSVGKKVANKPVGHNWIIKMFMSRKLHILLTMIRSKLPEVVAVQRRLQLWFL